MCVSWKCFISIMSMRSRRFSLDSAISLDGVGPLGGRRGSSSSRFSSKKSRQSQSLDDARLEIHELHHSLNSNMPLRKQTIAEENLERSDGLNSHSFVKHNKSFHKLFPEIPEAETLTQTFTCALQKEVLYHGKLFVSEHHVCFHSSVLLKETKVVIPASSVREVKKHNSALSMMSIETADREKHSFVSLRNREMCYKLLETVCSHAQGVSSPHLSSAENEADRDLGSSYSSLEDSVDRDQSRQSSICLDNGFPQTSSEAPTRCSSARQNSLIDTDDRAVSWIWRIVQRVTSFSLLREDLSPFFYLYMMLMVVLLLVSGYIGLRIVALEAQLDSLGALTELSLRHKESD
ncbi:GRAM domain-containing protein 2B-like isoform X2 [Acanthopagrus latus]|uniref:GRAM domain-containing protein 2B-like isoform X2 n=1 Tax=Acanthopagrus latus TaxID=8177 RepID=UPI00187CC7CC|nr:GRAM domain-containing protein 2B-like isoform X2 [Acanthopagrus latus]